jgi:hypothetical protein
LAVGVKRLDPTHTRRLVQEDQAGRIQSTAKAKSALFADAGTFPQIFFRLAFRSHVPRIAASVASSESAAAVCRPIADHCSSPAASVAVFEPNFTPSAHAAVAAAVSDSATFGRFTEHGLCSESSAAKVFGPVALIWRREALAGHISCP